VLIRFGAALAPAEASTKTISAATNGAATSGRSAFI